MRVWIIAWIEPWCSWSCTYKCSMNWLLQGLVCTSRCLSFLEAHSCLLFAPSLDSSYTCSWIFSSTGMSVGNQGALAALIQKWGPKPLGSSSVTSFGTGDEDTVDQEHSMQAAAGPQVGVVNTGLELFSSSYNARTMQNQFRNEGSVYLLKLPQWLITQKYIILTDPYQVRGHPPIDAVTSQASRVVELLLESCTLVVTSSVKIVLNWTTDVARILFGYPYQSLLPLVHHRRAVCIYVNPALSISIFNVNMTSVALAAFVKPASKWIRWWQSCYSERTQCTGCTIDLSCITRWVFMEMFVAICTMAVYIFACFSFL